MATKQCIGECGKKLPLSDFGKNRRTADGLESQCRECINTAQRQRYADNPEKARAAKRRWRSPNPEKQLATAARWRAANPEKMRAAARQRRADNPKKEQAAARRRYAANPEAAWKQHLWRKYKMTPEQYDQLFKEQKGLCAICRKPETAKRNGKTKKLAADHDHATGKHRGLLCHRCNAGLGLFQDDPEYLKAGADYLRQHS